MAVPVTADGKAARPYLHASRSLGDVRLRRGLRATQAQGKITPPCAAWVGAHLPTLDQTICAPLRIQLTQLPTTKFGRENTALSG